MFVEQNLNVWCNKKFKLLRSSKYFLNILSIIFNIGFKPWKTPGNQPVKLMNMMSNANKMSVSGTRR